MLEFGWENSKSCQGLSRRSMLHLGTLSAFGLSLPKLLAAEVTPPAGKRKERNVILLWMGGGPANMDTFDMKPNAPAEYRGEFQPIATTVPGVEICEHHTGLGQRV